MTGDGGEAIRVLHTNCADKWLALFSAASLVDAALMFEPSKKQSTTLVTHIVTLNLLRPIQKKKKEQEPKAQPR